LYSFGRYDTDDLKRQQTCDKKFVRSTNAPLLTACLGCGQWKQVSFDVNKGLAPSTQVKIFSST
jgi:hypothetical protein